MDTRTRRPFGHVYFVSIGPKITKIFEKFAAIKSLLNPHFKGFGAITRSGFCWSCFSDHFGMVDVPFRPMDDHFVTILVFFAVLVTFFGHFLVTFRVKKRISFSRSRWTKLKTTDLEKSVRTDLGKKRFDCRSSKWPKRFAQKCKFWTNFFSTLDFIWKSHSFQFLVYALPNRFWQVLMKF